MAYTPTTWVNDQVPAMSAANLNKLTDELKAQAATYSVSHTLPTWANGVAPALTDPVPLNEMERVAAAVAAIRGYGYTPTVWQAGWTPTRNAARLNNLEQQALENSTAAAGYHWYENFQSAIVPANFLTEITSFGGNPATISYAFVADALGVEGTVARFRCNYDPSQGTAYVDAVSRQLVSFYRTAQNARSGYQQVAEDTWYRCRFKFPAGCVFSSGETNFLHEWHTDNDTQGQGGNSSSMYVPCNYPLVQTGVNPTICLRFAAGTPASPSYTYWPSSDGSGSYAARNGTPVQFNHWYDALFHIIWSKNAAVGRMEWWLDGVLQVSRTQATAYANANLVNGQAYHTFGIYDYRYNVSGGDSIVDWGLTAAGPSQATVA